MSRFSRFSVKIRRFWLEYGHFFRVLSNFSSIKINRFKCLFLDHIKGEEIQSYSIGISGGNWHDAPPVKSDFNTFKCFRCEKQFKEDCRLRQDQFVCPYSEIKEQLILPFCYLTQPNVLQVPFSGSSNIPVISSGQYVYDESKQTYQYWNGNNWIAVLSNNLVYNPRLDGYTLNFNGGSQFISASDLANAPHV